MKTKITDLTTTHIDRLNWLVILHTTHVTCTTALIGQLRLCHTVSCIDNIIAAQYFKIIFLAVARYKTVSEHYHAHYVISSLTDYSANLDCGERCAS